MHSRLETVPRDVLQHIAFLSASASTFEPPGEILQLLQTSSSIYRQLNIYAAPDLYARLFSTKFDTQAPYRRCARRLTDSALTAELLNRCQLLRRTKRVDISSPGLMQDLWTALWMFLESDGLNEQQLSAVGFPEFIIGVARAVLVDPGVVDHRTNAQTLKAIIVWLLCLSLRRGTILDMSKRDRDELFRTIFPFIFLSNKIPKSSAPGLSSASPCGGGRGSSAHALDGELAALIARGTSMLDHHAQVSVYGRRSTPLVPDPSTAAIHLAFVIYEATIIEIPRHLPESREIANATLRSGPTQEDYTALASYRTPLPTDSLPHGSGKADGVPQPVLGTIVPRSRLHDVQFRDVLKTLDARTNIIGAMDSDVFQYIPGTMAGVWEGVYRTVDVPVAIVESTKYRNPFASVVMVKPMQCALTEYICVRSTEECLPPEKDILDHLPESVDILNGFELLIGGRKYNKYVPPSRGMNEMHDQTQAAESNPLYDVILVGETLDDHDQAWGGYRFLGRVQKNGLVMLKRESKGASGQQPEGVWLFEGRLQSHSAILGRWRITGASAAGGLDDGIFSLGRSLERWKDRADDLNQSLGVA